MAARKSSSARRTGVRKSGMKRTAARKPFARKVRAIARAVIRQQADPKAFDTLAGATLSSATVPSGGGAVLAWFRLTTGPAQGITGATRVGNKIRASSSMIRWQVTNITNTTWASANKSMYLRVALLEMRDQIDFGYIETIPGNACFERSSANQDVSSTTNSRMNEFWNKRVFNVLSDKVYALGCGVQADRNKGMQGYIKHRWGGQEWTFENTGSENCTERRVYLVFVIDSQDSDRFATTTSEVQARLNAAVRLNYIDM